MHLVTALQCEADPLVNHLNMDGFREDRPFRMYRNEEDVLVVSGIGKTASAAATAYLQQVTGDRDNGGWLNVGLAGHGTASIGSGFLAARVTDRATGESWYPQPVFETSVDMESVVTVNRPETDYEEKMAFDMEAAGFYPTALRFSTTELVHCYKIVSDNPDAPPESLNREKARELVVDHVETVETLLNKIRTLSADLQSLTEPPPEKEEFLEQWHFSVTRARSLEKLLKKHRAVFDGKPATVDDYRQLDDAGEVVNDPRKRIESSGSGAGVSK